MSNEELIRYLESKEIDGSEGPESLDYDISDDVENWEGEVFTRSGSSKCCIVFKDKKFVIKWTCDRNGADSDKDEALDEVRIYEHAKAQGLEMFFPKTEVFAEINGVFFIRQEMVDISCSDLPSITERKYAKQSRTASEKIMNKVQAAFDEVRHGRYCRTLNQTWVSMALVLYGKNIVKKFCEFAQKEGINDLHDGNIGYKNNRPILLDFSGFERD